MEVSNSSHLLHEESGGHILSGRAWIQVGFTYVAAAISGQRDE